MSERARTGVAALGLTMQCPDLGSFSATLTAVAMPAGVQPRVVRDGLKARGILTAAGLGAFESSSIRIGHMGDIGLADIDRTLVALGDVLAGQTPR